MLMGNTRIMKNLMLFCLFMSAPLFADEESEALPDRYSQLGLKPVEQLDNFKFRRWSYGDRQSLVLRTRPRGSFLIVFNKPIRRSNLEIDLETKDRTLKSGETKACLVSEMVNMKMRVDRSSRPMTGVRNCDFRVEAIYPLKDMEQEKRVIKFLRENDS